MTVRNLPGVQASIYDSSALPEGEENLTVGCVLRASRGPLGANAVTNPNDLLTKYTYTGKPSVKDDPTFWGLLLVLSKTNLVYVSRAQKNALYGGAIVKKETIIGNLDSVDVETKHIVIASDVTNLVTNGNTIRLYNENMNLNQRYTIVSASFAESKTTIVVSETVSNITVPNGEFVQVLKTQQPNPLTEEKIGVVTATSTTGNTITVTGDVTLHALVGDRVQLKNSTTTSVNGYYTVVSRAYSSPSTTITVAEEINENATTGDLYRNSIANPEGYAFKDEDLFLIVNTNQGDYAQNINYTIESYTETPDELATENTMQLTIYDGNTNTTLETPYICSRNQTAKAIDGTRLYIEDVLSNSEYIKVVDNTNINEDVLPCNTIAIEALGGGYNGDTLLEADYINALSYFEDKTIPISILMNGECESLLYHQAMIALCDTRTDAIPFLSSRLSDEKAQSNTKKAQNIVDYKKSLGSTTWLGTMYANHVKYPDIFNSRTVTIGADAVAVAGWLTVIANQGYPFAYAGPLYGGISGVTTDWKIGDESGEASLLNNSSINYIAYDAKLGQYYMQTQNTLQVAKSSLRNLGSVCNILDTKETLKRYFKQYLQLPITSDLRGDMVKKGTNLLETAKDQNRYSNFSFVDASTNTDISNDTLVFVATLAPANYAQNIYLTMKIVNQTFDFTITQGA